MQRQMPRRSRAFEGLDGPGRCRRVTWYTGVYVLISVWVRGTCVKRAFERHEIVAQGGVCTVAM